MHSSRQQYYGKVLRGNSALHFPTVSIPIYPGFVGYTLLARSLLDLVHAESKDTTVRLVTSLTKRNLPRAVHVAT